ncbi:hypothetical protein VFPPC_13151 [Pochonia chlamydosporia 170]|uniref:Uncharacterized protein n=1 Tax=Pochonia chlamydosporia 170 TaxID=1380566 RepID=A0A179G8S9_METCM|nr:hypothetical protein VFPPC_13151 [Pochonia chlamydosporia 170]OAQ74212.1 hypothetical protein VFPPC_13151 [Pochonia chlamydosporia 170]
MEDQFGGRTDDDLFYDDFEPVESEPIVVQEEAQPAPDPVPAPVAPEPTQPRQTRPKKSSPPVQTSNNHAPSPSRAQSQPSPQPQTQTKGGNLSSSRFARKGNFNMKQQSTPPPPTSKSPAPPRETEKEKQVAVTDNKPKGESPPPNTPTAPAKDKRSHSTSQNTALNAEARLQSGANPRQKLTDDELAAKMEQMKLLAAEKTRQFERAEMDEKQHAQAYAKGMEDARKRRAEEAERKRRGEEDKRKLDDERAKNRERKLKAMGMKEGGWDEGKEAILEEEARRGFRGANGGIRGTKRGGLGGSRYAREGDDQPDVDRFLDDRNRGRGRGRGGRGGGRGRGGFGGSSPKPVDRNAPAPSLTVDEFPALPSDGTKKRTEPAAPAAYPPKSAAAPIPKLPSPPPPGSKWDDEMEALDELKQQGKS